MSIEIWLLFVASELLLCLTPGPAVLLIVSQGMRHGFSASATGSAGLLSVNALWFALSALGLGGLLVASATLFGIVKWVGAAYLVYLGLRMILATLYRESKDRAEETSEIAGEPAARRKMFSQGLVTQVANPKAVVFFTALLPQFISPDGNLIFQFVVFGLTSICVELCVLIAYGWSAEKGARLLGERAALLFERAGGALLIFAGIGLAAIDRR